MISYKIILIAAAIGVIPVAAWVWLISQYNQQHPRGISFFMKVFFWGVLSAIPASIVEIVLNETDSNNQIVQAMANVWSFQQTNEWLVTLISTLLVGIIEELSKGLAIFLAVASKKCKIHNDGLVFGALVGLAFAVTENGVYFAMAISSPESGALTSVVILRFLLSTTAHVIYSGLVGKFLAAAALSSEQASKIGFLALAFILPVGIHTIFNFLLATSLSWLVAFIIVGGIFLLWHFYSLASEEPEPKEEVEIPQSLEPENLSKL